MHKIAKFTIYIKLLKGTFNFVLFFGQIAITIPAYVLITLISLLVHQSVINKTINQYPQ